MTAVKAFRCVCLVMSYSCHKWASTPPGWDGLSCRPATRARTESTDALNSCPCLQCPSNARLRGEQRQNKSVRTEKKCLYICEWRATWRLRCGVLAYVSHSLWNGSIFRLLRFWSEMSSSFRLTHWIPRLAKLGVKTRGTVQIKCKDTPRNLKYQNGRERRRMLTCDVGCCEGWMWQNRSLYHLDSLCPRGSGGEAGVGGLWSPKKLWRWPSLSRRWNPESERKKRTRFIAKIQNKFRAVMPINVIFLIENTEKVV